MNDPKQSSESPNQIRFPLNPATTSSPRRTLAFFGPNMNKRIARALWPGLLDGPGHMT